MICPFLLTPSPPYHARPQDKAHDNTIRNANTGTGSGKLRMPRNCALVGVRRAAHRSRCQTSVFVTEDIGHRPSRLYVDFGRWTWCPQSFVGGRWILPNGLSIESSSTGPDLNGKLDNWTVQIEKTRLKSTGIGPDHGHELAERATQ